MMEKDFYINRNFFIQPGANLLTNQATAEKTRLEPRLMQLLLILVERQGVTVTRDELVTTIWQDYGGGDEGLTQAISMLRKLFLDDKKELIQTVPKKGYVLNAIVSYGINQVEEKSKNKMPPVSGNKKALIILSIAIIGLTASIVCFKTAAKKNGVPASTVVPYPTNMADEKLLEENETNTITTLGPDSTLYKLVIIGDRPPEFYINNKRISEDHWEAYMQLINSLKIKLKERESQHSDKSFYKSSNKLK